MIQCAETKKLLSKITELSRELNKLGWKDPHPYSDVGKALLILEANSTGIHNGYCGDKESDGIDGYWIACADGDIVSTTPFKVKENL